MSASAPVTDTGTPVSSANASPDPHWRTRVIYGVGGVADRIGNQGLKDLGNPIYNLILGINPAVIGAVFVITRLFDAFFDPVVGAWSDNARTRWGRRKPFLLAGAVLSAFAIVPVFWLPQALSGTAQIAWMIVFTLLFYAAYTLFSVPYRALAYEIAESTHAKTRLLGVRTVFTMLSSVLTPWVFPLAQSGFLGSPREAVPWIAGGLGLMILVTALIPALCLRETSARTIAATPRVPLRESLAHTLRCRPFLVLVGMGAATVAGVNIGFGFGGYLTIYHVYAGDAAAASPLLGWTGMSFIAVALLAVPAMTALSTRLGKGRTLQILLGWATLGSLGSWWLYNPALPWLQLLHPLFLAPGTVGLWLLGESMVGDVCAADAARHGERREAMFSAVFGWILKTATAFAILVSNVLLNTTGFDVALGANQAETTVTGMRLLYAGFPAAGFVASIFILRAFSLRRG